MGSKQPHELDSTQETMGAIEVFVCTVIADVIATCVVATTDHDITDLPATAEELDEVDEGG